MSRSRQPANGEKFGGGTLLRTKHIDTLEVLEDYTKDMDRLQKENKQLQQQLAKLSGLSDPAARIASLEKILNVERDSNQEMSQRIKMLGIEAERHRTDLSNREIAHRQSLGELQAHYRALQDTHNQCLSTKQLLSDKIAALSEQNMTAEVAVKRYEKELATMNQTLQAQSTRLQALEVSAATANQAQVTSAAAAPGDETARQTKLKLTKTKEKLSQKETQLAGLLEEISILRQNLSQVEKRERELMIGFDQAREELAFLRRKVTELEHKDQSGTEERERLKSELQLAKEKRKSTTSTVKIDREREEFQRREKEWMNERKEMEKELEALKKVNATLQHQQSSQPPPPSQPSRSKKDELLIQELRSQVSQLQHDLQLTRQQFDQQQEQYTHLRQEHTKVSQSFNRMLSNTGAANTITIASKKGMFPEYVQLKRENEQLQAQVSELQQTIHMLNTRAAQNQVSLHAQLALNGTSNIQQLQRVGGTKSTQPPAAISSSKSLSLIAAHENSLAAPPLIPTLSTSSAPSSSPSSATNSNLSIPSSSLSLQAHSASSAARRASSHASLTTSGSLSRRASGGWPAASTSTSGSGGVAPLSMMNTTSNGSGGLVGRVRK